MIQEEIKKNALQLNTIDSAHLAEILLESLDQTDKKIEKVWATESEKRYKAYLDGRVKGITLEQFHDRRR